MPVPDALRNAMSVSPSPSKSPATNWPLVVATGRPPALTIEKTPLWFSQIPRPGLAEPVMLMTSMSPSPSTSPAAMNRASKLAARAAKVTAEKGLLLALLETRVKVPPSLRQKFTPVGAPVLLRTMTSMSPSPSKSPANDWVLAVTVGSVGLLVA
ncbi:hypothetical protein EJ913_30805 [Azospirillum doebereinerae]|uniref:Uncharacterized protein n=1 Tax=Azospirillum doebereinerae TaxID=92933 RepID=A0A433IZC1_9PROT|nr:hypothetical protein EJ913_30805 [Azospirillum doebereinerae]